MKLVKDISKEDFSGFAVGDSFATRGIFFGVSDAPLVWGMTDKSKNEFFFSVTYFGVHIGNYCINNGVATELA